MEVNATIERQVFSRNVNRLPHENSNIIVIYTVCAPCYRGGGKEGDGEKGRRGDGGGGSNLSVCLTENVNDNSDDRE